MLINIVCFSFSWNGPGLFGEPACICEPAGGCLVPPVCEDKAGICTKPLLLVLHKIQLEIQLSNNITCLCTRACQVVSLEITVILIKIWGLWRRYAHLQKLAICTPLQGLKLQTQMAAGRSLCFFFWGAGMSPLKTWLTCATVLLGMFCRWFTSLLFCCFFFPLNLLCLTICFSLCQTAMNSGRWCICLLTTCCRHCHSVWPPDRPVTARHVCLCVCVSEHCCRNLTLSSVKKGNRVIQIK